jgi:hypothetical protein
MEKQQIKETLMSVMQDRTIRIQREEIENLTSENLNLKREKTDIYNENFGNKLRLEEMTKKYEEEKEKKDRWFNACYKNEHIEHKLEKSRMELEIYNGQIKEAQLTRDTISKVQGKISNDFKTLNTGIFGEMIGKELGQTGGCLYPGCTRRIYLRFNQEIMERKNKIHINLSTNIVLKKKPLYQIYTDPRTERNTGLQGRKLAYIIAQDFLLGEEPLGNTHKKLNYYCTDHIKSASDFSRLWNVLFGRDGIQQTRRVLNFISTKPEDNFNMYNGIESYMSISPDILKMSNIYRAFEKIACIQMAETKEIRELGYGKTNSCNYEFVSVNALIPKYSVRTGVWDNIILKTLECLLPEHYSQYNIEPNFLQERSAYHLTKSYIKVDSRIIDEVFKIKQYAKFESSHFNCIDCSESLFTTRTGETIILNFEKFLYPSVGLVNFPYPMSFSTNILRSDGILPTDYMLVEPGEEGGFSYIRVKRCVKCSKETSRVMEYALAACDSYNKALNFKSLALKKKINVNEFNGSSCDSSDFRIIRDLFLKSKKNMDALLNEIIGNLIHAKRDVGRFLNQCPGASPDSFLIFETLATYKSYVEWIANQVTILTKRRVSKLTIPDSFVSKYKSIHDRARLSQMCESEMVTNQSIYYYAAISDRYGEQYIYNHLSPKWPKERPESLFERLEYEFERNIIDMRMIAGSQNKILI